MFKYWWSKRLWFESLMFYKHPSTALQNLTLKRHEFSFILPICFENSHFDLNLWMCFFVQKIFFIRWLIFGGFQQFSPSRKWLPWSKGLWNCVRIYDLILYFILNKCLKHSKPLIYHLMQFPLLWWKFSNLDFWKWISFLNRNDYICVFASNNQTYLW